MDFVILGTMEDPHVSMVMDRLPPDIKPVVLDYDNPPEIDIVHRAGEKPLLCAGGEAVPSCTVCLPQTRCPRKGRRRRDGRSLRD